MASAHTPSVLIIEQDSTSASELVSVLDGSGIAVTVSSDRKCDIASAKCHNFHAAILDLGFSGRAGLEILTELRHLGLTIPVLILTHRDCVDERITGFAAGADDYVVKPYAQSEVLARIKALLRRCPGNNERLTVADLECDLSRRTVVRAGHVLDLTPIEFALLRLLMMSSGEPIARRIIAEKIWGIHFDSETNIVEVGIRRLRLKVDVPFAVKLIQSIKGRGYTCFVPTSDSTEHSREYASAATALNGQSLTLAGRE